MARNDIINTDGTIKWDTVGGFKDSIDQHTTQLAEKASLNGTVYIDTFDNFTDAVSYCITNNKILDLCATTVTADPSYNGMQLCSLKNGTVILNDYIRFYVAANTIIQDMTFIDNYVYSKTTSVPANFDQVTLGWVIESLNGSSDNVTIRRVTSYSSNSAVSDGSSRTRGFINIKGNNVLMEDCIFKDSRNAVRMGINSTNSPQWYDIGIKGCHFFNVEQCIDLLNVGRVMIDNCTLVNTPIQQSNYSVLFGADFVCSISSDDIYVSNIKVSYPVERTCYIVNSKRFHLNGFNISYGGLGSGGGIKVCGWGTTANTYMSVDAIIENGYCGTTANQYFDLYGVDGVTIRNITTISGGSGILAQMTNVNRRVHFENVRASINGAMIYAYAQQNAQVTTNDNGLEVTNLTVKNCTITCMQNSTNYLITTANNTGTTPQYSTFDSWNIFDNTINLDSSITTTKFLFDSTSYGSVTNIKVVNTKTNSNYFSLYDFTNNSNVQHWVNINLTGKSKTNNYMYGLDMPNVLSYLPSGTYSLDLYFSNTQYGNLVREDSGNITFKRIFKTTGTEYILRRVTSGKTLNVTSIFEIDSPSFSCKFLLTSNGTSLTTTSYYGTITNNTNNIALPNGDQIQLDTASFPSSLRYSATTTNPINVKMTILSATYV